MQRKCRRRFHKAPNENDAETTDIDNLAALFAQYAESAPIPTRRGTARRSGGRRSKNAVQFDCPEDSDEARANWTIGTVPMCERWFVSTISALSLSQGLYYLHCIHRLVDFTLSLLITLVCSIERGFVHRDCVQCRGKSICYHRRRRRSCKICLGTGGRSTKRKRKTRRKKTAKSGSSNFDTQA